MRAELAMPSKHGRVPAIVVAHELFGVNEDIRRVTERIASLGYIGIAPEFYHRYAPPGCALERNDEGRKRGFEYLNHVSRAEAIADVSATLSHLRSRPDCDGRVGVLGFSAGGHIAFLAATQLDVAATALLYPGWLTGGDVPIAGPEPTISLATGIAQQHGRLLFIAGGRDAIISAQTVAQIETALSEAGANAEVVIYLQAQHAFFWEGTPAFDRAARDAAWRRVERFFFQAFAPA